MRSLGFDALRGAAARIGFRSRPIRNPTGPRRGEISPLALLVVVFLIFGGVAFWWRNMRDVAPMSILESRFVTCDIKEYSNYRRMLSMTPELVAPAIGVGEAEDDGALGADVEVGGSLGAAGAMLAAKSKARGPWSVVVTRDDPQGDFLLLRVRLSQDYVDSRRIIKSSRDHFSNSIFELVGGEKPVNPVFLVPGTYSDENGVERAALAGLKIRAEGTGAERTFTVFGEDWSAAFPDDETYVRPTVTDRIRAIAPSTLEDNLWVGVLQSDKSEGWMGAEVLCLFPRPEAGTEASLRFDRDEKSAVAVETTTP